MFKKILFLLYVASTSFAMERDQYHGELYANNTMFDLNNVSSQLIEMQNGDVSFVLNASNLGDFNLFETTLYLKNEGTAERSIAQCNYKWKPRITGDTIVPRTRAPAEIDFFYTNPEYRRKKCATLLLNMCLTLLVEKGCTQVICRFNTSNVTAAMFLQKNKFQITNSRYQDEVVYYKNLTSMEDHQK